MSTKGIEEVLARAMSDPAFTDALFKDAEKTLTGFDLAADELTLFKNMTRAEFETFAKSSPEERKSMWGGAIGAGI